MTIFALIDISSIAHSYVCVCIVVNFISKKPFQHHYRTRLNYCLFVWLNISTFFFVHIGLAVVITYNGVAAISRKHSLAYLFTWVEQKWAKANKQRNFECELIRFTIKWGTKIVYTSYPTSQSIAYEER